MCVFGCNVSLDSAVVFPMDPVPVLRRHSKGIVFRVREIRARCLSVDTLPAESMADLRGYTTLESARHDHLKNAIETITGAPVVVDSSHEALRERCESLRSDDGLFESVLIRDISYLTDKIVLVLMMSEDIRQIMIRQYNEDDDCSGMAADIVERTRLDVMRLLSELVERRNCLTDLARTQLPDRRFPIPVDRKVLEGDHRLRKTLMLRLKSFGTL